MSYDKNRAPTEDESRTAERDELHQLREENARLKVLLTSHNITWEEIPNATQESSPEEKHQYQTSSPLPIR